VPTPAEYAVDANVILRYVLRDDAGLFRKANAVFAAMEAGQVALICDPVNLAAAVWVLGSVYGASEREAAEALLPVVKAAGFRMSDKDRYIRALEWYGEGRMEFGNACACATAAHAAEGRLVSFDRRLSRAPGIERAEAVGRAEGEGAD